MASKNNNTHLFYIRWMRILETLYRTYKQDKEFWNTNPQPGKCPTSPGPLLLKSEME